MEELNETQIRHLEAIQGVINRMASNSLFLKTISGTITAAVVAYAGAATTSAPKFVLAAIVPVIVFWIMDAQYLRIERLFRKLYDAACKGDIVGRPFSMDITPYKNQVQSTARIARSWSVIWFYLVLVILLLVLSTTI